MKLAINDIIDKHKGKRGIVVGHGPSLNNNSGRLFELKNEGYIIVGCNNWDEFYLNSPPHYWISANNEDDSKKLLPLINKYKPIWVYADTVDLVDQNWLAENIQTDFLPYDQRHFNGKQCSACISHGCDKYRDVNRLTIQEELSKYSNYVGHYSGGYTVVLHSIAFSVLMGFSEIYVTGVDLDYSIGYAKNTVNRRIPVVPEYFDSRSHGGDVINDMKIINDCAEKVGTKIYNTNKNSWWKTFEYKEIP